MKENANKIYMIGKRFGQVLVMKEADIQTCKNKKFTCLCSCGHIFDAQGNHLRDGSTKSCGHCGGVTLSDSEISQIAKDYLDKHPPIKQYNPCHKRNAYKIDSPYRKRLMSIWKSMKQRCYNPKAINYSRYGARGIIICDEWHDFVSFFDWSITNGYNDGLTIDRNDNDGNYEPTNCRWVDYQTQAQNRRSAKNASGVVQLTDDGEMIAEYRSVRDARTAINAPVASGIYHCISGKQKHAYGYRWMNKDEYLQERKKRKWQNPS